MTAARYIEWAPTAGFERHVACLWAAQYADSGEPHVDRVLPDGCIDLLWMGGELVVAGPDTSSALVTPRPGARVVGVRFRPGVAPAVLGVPAPLLLDSRVDARDVLGERVEPLVDRVARAPSAHGAALILAAEVATWIRAAPCVDRLVERAVLDLRAPREDHTVAQLAAALGVSERQLRRRFVDALGYGPKTFERIMRLRRFVALAAGEGAPRLAELAAAAGYADQPHLTREVRALAGCGPAALVGYPVTAA